MGLYDVINKITLLDTVNETEKLLSTNTVCNSNLRMVVT